METIEDDCHRQLGCRRGRSPVLSLQFSLINFLSQYGLIGSTEWGEDFAEWIQKHVVAYVNLDTAVAGSNFRAGASPLLAHFVRKTAEDQPHPTDPKRTLWDATADRGQLFGEHDDIDSLGTEVETQAADSLGIRLLGSGSDFTVFLQRLGVQLMPCRLPFQPLTKQMA
jgi:N-acetylated-alpha-linked acidic dipeptidase